jgi:hypothetical protein
MRLATPATAGTSAAYRHLDRWPNSDDQARDVQPLVEVELRRLEGLRSREAFWAAFQLDMLTVPSRDLTRHLQDWYQRMAEELPQSSLWAIDIDRWLFSRQSVVRALLAADEVQNSWRDPLRNMMGFPPHVAFRVPAA